MRHILYLCLPLFLSSCGYFVQKIPDSDGSDLALSSDQLSFASLHEAVFRPRCVQCHAQYGSYNGVRTEISAIVAAVSSNRMPKNGAPLSAPLKDALARWAALGAPEFPNSAPPPLPTLEPKFESLHALVFTPLCISCHNPAGQARFLDLSTREAVLTAAGREFGGKKLLDLLDPDSSYLLDVLDDDVEPMPPTWSNLRRVTAEERAVLREWIAAGLP